MAATRIIILATVAVLSATVTATAQTRPGTVERRDFATFNTTGTPTGYTLPRVPIQRRNAQPTPPMPTVQPYRPMQAESPPPEPENPKSLETGKVKSEPKDQSVPVAVQSLAPAQTPPAKYVKGMTVSGKAKAFDGHSLVVDGHAVRLDGADAPGLLQPCRAGAGATWRCGEDSYRRLASLVDGRKVTCRVEEQVGNGAAAICSVQGVRDLAEVMVREGFAIPNGHDEGRYSAAAAAARAGKVGMWVGSFESPSRWRESASR